MKINSLLRKEEHRVLSTINLNGKIIDLGGDTNSYYQKLIKGSFTITTLNLDSNSKPNIFHDLEKKLPIDNELYDNVLLINVLEHIFEYRQLLEESVRILRKGGHIVIAVPFMFPVHPSPNDYRRFTAQTLRMECEKVDLQQIEIYPLGAGVFSACMLFIDRLMPTPIRYICQWFIPLIISADKIFATIARIANKKYLPSDYALGYVVEAKK